MRAANHSFSSPEAPLLLVSTKNRDLWLHSVQTTGHSREHARDLSTSGQFPSSSHKIPRSTSTTRAISVLSSIILPLQTLFSRVLLLRKQPFSSENLPPERPTTTIAIKTQVFMFRYDFVNSTRKFTIVAEMVSLLKKIYKRDAPFRAVFKVKTLAVLFLAYPREMKHIPQNLNLPPFCRCLFLWKWCNPFPRARARLKHAHSFDRCGTSGQVQHRKSAIHGLPVTLRMFRVMSDKSDWLWSQSIVFTKPFKNGMSLDMARGRDFWCWPKGARPLGTRMLITRKIMRSRNAQCNIRRRQRQRRLNMNL